MKRVSSLSLLIVVFSSFSLGAAQVRRFDSRSASPGTFARARDGVSRVEQFSFDSDLPAFLADVPMETEVRLRDWPLSPGLRGDVALTRHDVYAPDAHIYRVDAAQVTELPRSSLLFFWGTAAQDENTRVVVIFDPGKKTFRGLAQTPAGVQELRSETEGVAGRHLLGEARSFLSPWESAQPWTCLGEELPFNSKTDGASRRVLAGVAPLAITSLHTATMAVDTDNELMAYYGDNTTNATNYIASLFASMNLIYERDLLVRLVQGTTFLRVTTTLDPYLLGVNSGAGLSNLNEFSNYWGANYSGVPRALAMMLSGKQSSSNSASGIAWLDSLCSTGAGYSYSQVFKINYLAGDTYVVAHEIGHNFGSLHTHCYIPPIDTCYNGESCYSGPTSCPAPATYSGMANVTGTLMSYCHISGLPGCTSSPVYHPRSIAFLQPKIVLAVGTCIFPFTVAAAGPAMFYSLTPCRILDTRGATGALAGPALQANATRIFGVAGACGVPATAKSISTNVTITQPAASGDLKMFPGDLGVPSGTAISFSAGATRANNAQVRLPTNATGTIAVQNESTGTVQFILDVNGYFQ